MAGVVRAKVKANVGDGEVGAFAYPAADLDDAEAEGVELEGGNLGLEQPASELIEEPVGGRVEQKAESVGPEAMIAEAVSVEGVLEVLDPVLRLAAVDVPVVQRPVIFELQCADRVSDSFKGI